MDTVPPEEVRANSHAHPQGLPTAMSGAPCPAGDTAGPAPRAKDCVFRPQAAPLNQPAAAAHGQDRPNETAYKILSFSSFLLNMNRE